MSNMFSTSPFQGGGSFTVTDFPITSGVTNFPAASKKSWLCVTSAGWLGGAAGVGMYVNIGDLLYCNADTVAGTFAEVGDYWNHYRHMVSLPDGYRYIALSSNTEAPTDINNGFYWLNGVMHKIENSVHDPVCSSGSKVKMTPDGGIAIKLINKTGSASVKGYCVTTDTTTANAVKLVPVGEPNCIGVFYESGVADGSAAWVVVSGIADVYFWGSTTMGYLARTGLAADTGEVAGQALSEAIPTSPFDEDKHFCEIGHCLETRTGAGLAKVVLHFN